MNPEHSSHPPAGGVRLGAELFPTDAETRAGATTAAPARRQALPAERDAFLGREPDLARLEGRLAAGSALVTLIGAAGMGKTRLAVRLGWRTLERWPGGVWFCDATEARTLDGLASTVATSLGVSLGKGDPIEQLGHAIASRGRCLVILDNLEQVVPHAATALASWLNRARHAQFLATSRERLNVPGEELHSVGPLELDQGVALFVERARKRAADFDPRGAELKAVRELVKMVDGMPLAIELAATRVRAMTASEALAHMRERFRLLSGGPRGRHATLRVAIGASWELLAPWEKAAWAQCSVFEGGFTLEAAQEVMDLSPWPSAPWLVDVLQSLVDKSLLRVWAPSATPAATAAEPRFGMYASLQEYARDRLAEAGAIPEGASGPAAVRAAEERHGRWLASFGTDPMVETLDHPHGLALRGALMLEIENLVAGCRRAQARGDTATAVATYRAAWAVLEFRGPAGLAIGLGESILARPLRPAERARALSTLGFAEMRAGRAQEARAHLEEALAAHRELGHRRLEGVVLGALGSFHVDRGHGDEARACLGAALAIHREVGARHLEGNVIGNLGNLCRDQGLMDEARAHFLAALAIHREVGDRRSEGITLGNLGLVYRQRGEVELARAHLESSLAIHRELGVRRSEAIVLGNLANLHLEQGRLAEARAHYDAALAAMREIGDRRSEGVSVGNLGNLCRRQGRLEEAQKLYEASLAIHREVGNRRFEGVAIANLGRVHLDQGDFGAARHAFAQAEPILLEVADRLELGLLLCARARLEAREGHPAEARAALDQAEALATRAGVGPESELRHEIHSLHETLAV